MGRSIFNMLCSITQGTKNFLCNWYKHSNEKWNHEQQLQLQNQIYLQKQYLDSCIYETMCQISDELFPVLQGRAYNNLCAIHSSADIRIKNYKPYNGSYIYCFEIAKQTDTPYAFSVLESIRNKMQMDIKRYQQDLIAAYDYTYVQHFYPFIYSGIYVMKIADAGTDIRLFIASNYLV